MILFSQKKGAGKAEAKRVIPAVAEEKEKIPLDEESRWGLDRGTMKA